MGNPDTDSSCCSMERNTMLKDVKVVVVGQAKCGKTALVQRFVNNIFSNTYTPTGFEKYAKKCKVGEFTVQFSIWDTSGSGSYDNIRPLAYPDANVFLLCFNIGDQDSLDLAINKWYPEIRSHCTTTPVILCGCQGDVRNMDNIDKISLNLSEKKTQYKFPQIITNEQIVMALYHITATAYVETSSLYEDEIITCNNNKNNSFNSSIHYNNSNNNNNNNNNKNNNNSMSSTMTTTGVLEAFEIAAEAALGLLNKKNLTKKKKNDDCQNPILIKTNKKQLKNKLKGRSKNCCVM